MPPAQLGVASAGRQTCHSQTRLPRQLVPPSVVVVVEAATLDLHAWRRTSLVANEQQPYCACGAFLCPEQRGKQEAHRGSPAAALRYHVAILMNVPTCNALVLLSQKTAVRIRS